MSAECARCGADVVGCAPCELCELRAAVDRLTQECDDWRDWFETMRGCDDPLAREHSENMRLRARWDALTSDAAVEAAWDDMRVSWAATRYPNEWPTKEHLRAAIRAAMDAATNTTKED